MYPVAYNAESLLSIMEASLYYDSNDEALGNGTYRIIRKDPPQQEKHNETMFRNTGLENRL